jgi:hypothetical protein
MHRTFDTFDLIGLMIVAFFPHPDRPWMSHPANAHFATA